jgi:hypothetical protein
VVLTVAVGNSVTHRYVDFLTYRALRLSGKLSPEESKEELILTLQKLLLESTK